MLEQYDLDRVASGMYVQELFDHVQTHAVYRVPVEAVDEVKALLREKVKATRFRMVKSGIVGVVIVCFKARS